MEFTVFTTQDVNGKIAVKVNSPYRLHVNFITYRFLKLPWQSEQGLEDGGDPCVSKSGTSSSFFFILGIREATKNTVYAVETEYAHMISIWKRLDVFAKMDGKEWDVLQK